MSRGQRGARSGGRGGGGSAPTVKIPARCQAPACKKRPDYAVRQPGGDTLIWFCADCFHDLYKRGEAAAVASMN